MMRPSKTSIRSSGLKTMTKTPARKNPEMNLKKNLAKKSNYARVAADPPLPPFVHVEPHAVPTMARDEAFPIGSSR